jgi:SAM-dependent methyltransferase
MSAYSAYQRKYAGNIRDSDRVLLETVRTLLDGRANIGRPRLLDVGCSTGNLLLHLKHALPQLDLAGSDIVENIIEGCRANPDLEGVEFVTIDTLELGRFRGEFDIVTANAALMFFSEEEFERAIESIAAAIKPGGFFVAFDLFHPFEQEIALTETSKSFPNGLTFHLRSYSTALASLAKAGLSNPTFTPFDISIDLQKPADPSDVTSYTVQAATGARLSFRGTLFQPWCHVVAARIEN